MKKISVEVEELLNPKLSLTQQIVLVIQKEKNPITTNELYDKLPNYSQRGIRATVSELIKKKILTGESMLIYTLTTLKNASLKELV